MNPLSDGHFGLCVECRKRMVDDVYRDSPHHWNSDTERRKSKEAGGVIGGGLRLFVMEQFADHHWSDIRDKWGLDVDGEWKAGADESFPCHGGRYWIRIEATVLGEYACDSMYVIFLYRGPGRKSVPRAEHGVGMFPDTYARLRQD